MHFIDVEFGCGRGRALGARGVESVGECARYGLDQWRGSDSRWRRSRGHSRSPQHPTPHPESPWPSCSPPRPPSPRAPPWRRRTPRARERARERVRARAYSWAPAKRARARERGRGRGRERARERGGEREAGARALALGAACGNGRLRNGCEGDGVPQSHPCFLPLFLPLSRSLFAPLGGAFLSRRRGRRAPGNRPSAGSRSAAARVVAVADSGCFVVAHPTPPCRSRDRRAAPRPHLIPLPPPARIAAPRPSAPRALPPCAARARRASTRPCAAVPPTLACPRPWRRRTGLTRRAARARATACSGTRRSTAPTSTATVRFARPARRSTPRSARPRAPVRARARA